ncbi:DUF916 and DUF3324 domain-containing protein [Lactobacillus sp. CC-MHH1034]|uniref:DUF916 and DUF3324 domain-containing protein n=1 Tax=Agrilactobacillus fermenti TaxID=2586909 RepID=UPI001E307323|nr:DUF916 and DUF3324 domain-containing protein [Agrilactobacillus fermenti]MCD2256942.1 DUF916 and DUF3324 domain-containing protein [Agrilactobacillus fermenti]
MFTIGIVTNRVQAADDGIGFQVKAVPPAQQEDQNSNYFKLNLAPGQSTQMSVDVLNETNQAQSFRVRPIVAVTNDQGAIIYTDTSKSRDSSLKLDFSKLGPETKVFKVPAGRIGRYTTDVTVPNQPFNGMVLGGFFVDSPSLNQTAERQKRSKNSLQLTNQYGFAIGAQLNVGNVAAVKPDLRLQVVHPTVLDQKGTVQGVVQNFKANAIQSHRLNMHARVYKRGSNKVLHSNRVSNMSFAPNSHLNVPVSWGNDPMAAGDYTMKITSVLGDKGARDYRVWHLTRNFTITPSQAKRANQNPNLKKNYLWLIILLIILLVLLVVILLVYVYKRGKRANNGQSSTQSRTRKR